MVYRYRLSKNLHLLILPGVSLLLVLVSLSVILFWNPLIGILALAASAFLGWKLMKFFLNHINSIIRISDDGVSGTTSLGGEYTFLWKDLSLAGVYSCQGNGEEVFLYSDENDYLIRIPAAYSNPGDLTREIEEYSGEFVRWEGRERGDLEVQLRERFAPGMDTEQGNDSSPA